MATAMKDVLEREFDPTVVRVDVVKQDPLVKVTEDFSIVLENNGEKLHAIPVGGPPDFPTEMQSLMMISKIGTWLSKSSVAQ